MRYLSSNASSKLLLGFFDSMLVSLAKYVNVRYCMCDVGFLLDWVVIMDLCVAEWN